MNILFKNHLIQSFQNIITGYDNKGYSKQFVGGDIKYVYLSADVESYSSVRSMMKEGVEFIGFSAYGLITKLAYDTNEVPVGVSYSEVLDENGDPTGVQKKWFEWQPNPVMTRNDNTEVIIPFMYVNQAPTVDDLEILDGSIDITESMSLQEFRAIYQNDPAWLKDENGDPVVIPPIDKTALYYINNWENEAFDALHAQRLVNVWFNGLTGASITDKFNSLVRKEKVAVIQWGILPDTSEGKGLIEATITNKNNRTSARGWSYRRLYNARLIRFETAWIYLVDNFNNNAIVTRLQEMLSYEMKEFYISRGNSNQSNHLIINSEINPTFWATFTAADVAYSDRTLNDLKFGIEKILDGNKYASPVFL